MKEQNQFSQEWDGKPLSLEKIKAAVCTSNSKRDKALSNLIDLYYNKAIAEDKSEEESLKFALDSITETLSKSMLNH